MKKLLLATRTFITLIACILISTQAVAEKLNVNNPKVQNFITMMVTQHQFKRENLTKLLAQVEIQPQTLEKIQRPYEAKPWYIYEKHFLTPTRIENGYRYWQTHQKELMQAQQRYGIPANIIVAIIGVETAYGVKAGDQRVIDALATLAFQYPPRAKFFTKELAQFFILARENELNPLTIKGSYAGAIGLPQFMPSSYRHYAVGFKNKNRADLVNNHPDAIISVANYLKENGWAKGKPIAIEATLKGKPEVAFGSARSKPKTTIAQFVAQGIKPEKPIAKTTKAVLYQFKEPQGHSFWLGFHNFSTIMTYNRSPLYAMAVYQLAQNIQSLRASKLAEQKGQQSTKKLALVKKNNKP